MTEVQQHARAQPFGLFKREWGSGGLLSHHTRSGLLQTAWARVGHGLKRSTHALIDQVLPSPTGSPVVLSEDDWSNLEVDGQLWRALPWSPGVAEPEWSVVGRRASADIVINDYSVSTHHARVRMTPSGEDLDVVDLGSTNGTEVDGLILSQDEKATVKSRDVVVFGRQEFLFVGARDLYDLLVGDEAIRAESELAMRLPKDT